MLTPRTPNRSGCSLHQDQPSKGFSGGQNSPEGPQVYFYTCAYYTWLSAFYVQVKQQLLLLKKVFTSLNAPSFSFFSTTHHTLYPSSFPGRNNKTQFRVSRARVKLSQRSVYTPACPFPGTQAWQGQEERNQACQAKVIVSTVHLPHPSVICNSNSISTSANTPP